MGGWVGVGDTVLARSWESGLGYHRRLAWLGTGREYRLLDVTSKIKNGIEEEIQETVGGHIVPEAMFKLFLSSLSNLTLFPHSL